VRIVATGHPVGPTAPPLPWRGGRRGSGGASVAAGGGVASAGEREFDASVREGSGPARSADTIGWVGLDTHNDGPIACHVRGKHLQDDRLTARYDRPGEASIRLRGFIGLLRGTEFHLLNCRSVPLISAVNLWGAEKVENSGCQHGRPALFSLYWVAFACGGRGCHRLPDKGPGRVAQWCLFA
jgi:hypothetical protein